MLPESTSSGKAVRSLEAAIQQLKDSKSSYEKFAEIEPQTNTKKSIGSFFFFFSFFFFLSSFQDVYLFIYLKKKKI